MDDGLFGPLGSERYVEYVRDIRSSGGYLLAVINDILNMARIEAGKIELEKTDVALDLVVGEAISCHRDEITRKRLSLTTDLSSDLRLEADAHALFQIVGNLVDNAIKFTPEGGRIAVRIKPAPDALNLYVEDSGIGIPREKLGRIGRPFEQVEGDLIRSHGGSGLGLAIARSLAELHGGSLRIRSIMGSGTIVMVHLPLKSPAGAELEQAA